jgi:hypothetical protein
VEESKVKKCADAKETRENFEFDDRNVHLKNPPRGTCVDPQRLVQRVAERGVVVLKLLSQRLLSLGLIEVVGGALVCSRSCPGRATVTSGAGRTARDDEASVSCFGCRGITQSSSSITSTPAAGSGAGSGQFSNWPHPGGGALSLGISTTTA